MQMGTTVIFKLFSAIGNLLLAELGDNRTQQAPDVETRIYQRRCDVRRRIDIDTTSFRDHVPVGNDRLYFLTQQRMRE